MLAIPRITACVSQPAGSARINWANPLTRGLVFCALPVGTTYIDLVTNVLGERTGALTSRPYPARDGRSRRGNGIAVAATGTSTDQVVWPVSLSRGGNIVATGTVLALAGTTEQIDGKNYVIGGNIEAVSVGDGFSLQIDSFIYAGRGRIGRGRFSGIQQSSIAELVGNPFSNRTHFFGYSFRDNGVNGYWLGNRIGEAWTSSGSTFGSTTSNRRAVIHSTGAGTTTGSKNAYVNLMLMWDRELTPVEYQQLYDNPWQLLIESGNQSWFNALGGGGNVSLALSGISRLFSLGSLTPSTDRVISGQSLTGSQGSIVTELSKSVTGLSSASNLGSIVADNSHILQGQLIQSNSGSMSPAHSRAVSGSQLSAQTGSVVPATTRELVSSILQSDTGLIASELVRGLSGSSATFTSGIITAGNDVSIQLAGVNADFTSGLVLASTSRSISGIDLTSDQGTLTVQDANVTVSLTGIGLQSFSGDVAHLRTLAISGLSLTVFQGSITSSLALAIQGIQQALTAGSIQVASARALTSASLTSRTGNLYYGGVGYSDFYYINVPAYALSVSVRAYTMQLDIPGSNLNITV